jgi:hypothetical protein
VARKSTKDKSLSPFAALRRNSVTKGFLGGSNGWMAVGVVVWGGRLLRKALSRNEVVVATEKLQPGQVLELRTISPPSRSERRAARKARAGTSS